MMRIGAIGSCRVHLPLKSAQEANGITYIPSEGVAYVHNPLEVEQAISFMRGDTGAPPPGVRSLCGVRRARKDSYIYSKEFGAADVVVCEISSLRVVEFHGWQLQIHLCRNFLEAAGVDLKSLGMHQKPEGWYNRAGEAAKALELGLARSVLEEGNFYELNSNQIIYSVNRIANLLKKPLVICGIVTKTSNGRPIEQREMLSSALKSYAKGNSLVHFFDPDELVSEYGFSNIMRDMGHYQDGFIATVGSRIAAAACSLLNSSGHTLVGQSSTVPRGRATAVPAVS